MQSFYTIRVNEEWSERDTGDGYWMSLNRGWTLDDASVIHENTRRQCLQRLPECVYDLNHPSWRRVS